MSETITRPANIEALKDRVSLSVVVGRKVKLAGEGREFRGLCPFHTEKSGSFFVNDAKGFYHCFGCGAHGDHIEFLKRHEGLSFFGARDALVALSGLRLEDVQDQAPVRAKVSEDEAAAARAKKLAKAVKTWGYTRPARETLVETYLPVRGLSFALLGELSDRIRFGLVDYWFTPSTPEGATVAPKPIKLGRWPAMVTAIQDSPGLPDPRNPDRPHGLVGVHVTWLSDDGRGKRLIPHPETGEAMKAKKMFGVTRGAGLRLYRPAETMAVAEGIETALSARCTGWRDIAPGQLSVWAAGSLDNLAGRSLDQGPKHPNRPRARLRGIDPDPNDTGMVLPPECKRVLLVEDNDNGDPEMAESIYTLAAIRWRGEGREVFRVKPKPGTDLNDVLQGGA